MDEEERYNEVRSFGISWTFWARVITCFILVFVGVFIVFGLGFVWFLVWIVLFRVFYGLVFFSLDTILLRAQGVLPWVDLL